MTGSERGPCKGEELLPSTLTHYFIQILCNPRLYRRYHLHRRSIESCCYSDLLWSGTPVLSFLVGSAGYKAVQEGREDTNLE